MRKAAFVLFLLLVPSALLAQEDWRDRPGEPDRPGDRPRVRDRRGDPDDRDRVRRGRRDASLFELTPTLGYRYGGTIESDRNNGNLFDDDVQLDSAASLGVTLGIPVGWGDTKIELMVSHQSTELETDEGLFLPDADLADIDVTYYHAGVSIPFSYSPYVTPYFVLSAGVANLDIGVAGLESENRFSMSAGVGVKVPISRNVGFRFETRGYFTALDADDDDRCNRCDEGNALAQGETSLGVVFRF